ncbi:MAG: hypothetical protein U0V74_10075 [Chitinophagales bacterium]
MKPLLTVLLTLLITISFAQEEQVFTVQKPAAPAKQNFSGTYCSEFQGDGRFCFEFDSSGKVQSFVGTKQLKDIPAHKNDYPGFITDYVITKDSVLFVQHNASSYILNGQAQTSAIVSTYRGLIKGDKIVFNVEVLYNGNPTEPRKYEVTRLN